MNISKLLFFGLAISAAMVLMVQRFAAPQPNVVEGKEKVEILNLRDSKKFASRTSALANNLAQALNLFDNETDPMRREELIGNWISRIPHGNLHIFVSLLQDWKQKDELTSDLRLRLLRLWAKNDIYAAAEHAFNISGVAGRKQALNLVAVEWANQNVDDAISWIRQWPDATERQHALVSAASEIVRSDPMQAIKLAIEFEADGERDELLRRAAVEWAVASPAEVAAWAREIPDDHIRQNVISGVATIWSETDPHAAANLAIEALPPGRHQDNAITAIVQQWAQHDPEPTAGWVITLPEGSLRDTCLENLVKLWSEKDTRDTSAWLGSLPEGRDRDFAVLIYVRQLSLSSPQNALTLAHTITDNSFRHQALDILSGN